MIALLGIASALLIPNLVDRDVMTAEAAVRQLISDLSFAQSDALARQGYRRVYFYDDGRGYCIYRVTEAGFGDPFDPLAADYVEDPLSRAGSMGNYIVDYTADDRWEGVQITAVNIDGGQRFVTYDQLGGTVAIGLIPGTGGTVILSFDGSSYQITIAAFTGKLTVIKLS